MPNTTPKNDADNRKLFANPKTVSFQLEEAEVTQVVDASRARRIPYSQWLREAAREKLERETPKTKKAA